MSNHVTLSVVIPAFNESRTLALCVANVLAIADASLVLEIIIVDDGSMDNSLVIAQDLARQHPQISVIAQPVNRGKGAALREGFRKATGDLVAVQDADLEYDPADLKRLLDPLIAGKADVVLGSRFLSSGTHRVLYFWHSVANRILTLLSNMFTDLNLTDMETGYKVFRREAIQRIAIEENRFGVEPEVVAKMARQRLRIYETGISYHGRTYAEGKKIRLKDGFRALYSIVRYNAHWAPWPMQLAAYGFIGSAAAAVNWCLFMGLLAIGWDVRLAAPGAFVAAAWVNYALCVSLLFRHAVRWAPVGELVLFLLVVAAIGTVDWVTTTSLVGAGIAPGNAKLLATGVGFLLNFAGRRWIVFPEPSPQPWRPRDADRA